MSSSLLADTLPSVITDALKKNPDVLEAYNRKQSIRSEVRQAQAGYRPTVDLNAGFGYEYTDSPGTRGATDNTNEFDRGEFGLTLNQNLFNGFGTESEVERQQARLETADHRLDAVADETALTVVQRYLDVIKFREIKSLAEENRDVHYRIRDQIRLRSDAGVGRGADYDQIKARVSLVETNLVSAVANLRDAESNYKRVVGNEASDEMGAAEALTDLIPASVEEALQLAEAENPVLRSAFSDIKAANAQHKAARQNYYPRLDFEVASNFNNDIDGVDGYSNDVSAMLRMRYNLYNGGADDARLAQTASQVNEAQEVRNRSRRQLEETLRLAWTAFDSTKRQISLLESQVEYSIATRDAYVKQFNIGQRTLLDLLNTENELFQARQSLVAARSDHLFSQYRILAAMGRLVTSLNVSYTELLSSAD